MTEDDQKRLEEKIQKMTDEVIKDIDAILSKRRRRFFRFERLHWSIAGTGNRAAQDAKPYLPHVGGAMP